MGDIEKLNSENLLLLLQFVAPGFLIVYFRSLFVRRIEASFRDNLLLYVVLSVLYGFVTVPIWLAVRTWPSGGFWIWLTWLVALVLVPVASGIAFGLGVQRGWIRTLLRRIGLTPLSPYRTGWDWAFSQTRTSTYLLVTMEDGSQVAGLFSGNSLAASDLAQRDLFLEQTLEIDADGDWSPKQPGQSILISGKAIKYVEFFAGEASDGRETPPVA